MENTTTYWWGITMTHPRTNVTGTTSGTVSVPDGTSFHEVYDFARNTMIEQSEGKLNEANTLWFDVRPTTFPEGGR